MISGSLVGDKAFIVKLKALGPALRADVDQTTQMLGYGLEALIKSQYLSGQVFKVQTGRLRASISQGGSDSRSRFEATSDSSVYYVGTNVEYAKPLFYGHPGYTIRPVKAKALHFMIGGVDVFAMSAKIPAKPGKNVLTMALDQYKPTIVQQYQLSLQRTAERVLHS